MAPQFFGPSGERCPYFLAETKVATILGIFPLILIFSYLVTTVIQNTPLG
jgi:hypothetical protein